VARATVRYSFDGETTNVSGTRARTQLEGNGFSRLGTASLEAYGDVPDLVAALRELLDVLENPPGGGTLDHAWIYLDGLADED
jgi:hypothetical protein